jgi:glycerol kinase
MVAVRWRKMINTAAEIETLAASVPDNGGVYFVPALTGLAHHIGTI